MSDIYVFTLALAMPNTDCPSRAYNGIVITALQNFTDLRVFTASCKRDPWGEGGTPIYGLDRYVAPDRVWFLRVSFLK